MNTTKLLLASALVVGGGARAALADDAAPGQTPPTIQMLAPSLTGNNLRIGLACAADFASPDNGLQVTIDGEPRNAAIVNGEDYVGYTRHGNEVDTWVPTDVGFDVAPGHHHLTISAPDCLTDTRDVDIARMGATFVNGRLAIARDDMKGPVGAPNFFGLTVGAYFDFHPAIANAANDGVFGNSTYSLNSRTTNGVMFSALHERHHHVVALDSSFGYSSADGVGENAITTTQGTTMSAPMTFTQDELDVGFRLRIGARLPLHNFALAAGSGLGGELDIVTSRDGAGTNPLDSVHEANGPTGVFYIPVWAAVTYKPGCNWGFQGLASYNVQPTDPGSSSLTLGVGLMFQRSDACSEPEVIQVR